VLNHRLRTYRSEADVAERKNEHRPKDLRGGGWKEAVEELLMKDATKRAQAFVAAQEEDSDNDVVMRVPITFLVNFPRKGKTLAGDGDVDCACTIFSDPDGSQVCICTGTCPDFPDVCDEGPPFTEKE
jgi:hypothetical protein